MALTRWRPFAELTPLREFIQRWFEEPWPEAMLPSPLMPSVFRPVVPIDLYETDKEYVLKASLPGIRPEDIDIQLSDSMLTIRGEIKRDETIKRENYLCQERAYGKFARTLTLPGPVQADKVEAHFANGELTLTMPKAAEIVGRRIAVKAQSR